MRPAKTIEGSHHSLSKLLLGIGRQHPGKILGHVKAVTTLLHRDTDCVVFGIHDIGAMTGRIHQGQVSFFDVVGQRHVLGYRIEASPGGSDSLVQLRLTPKPMR